MPNGTVMWCNKEKGFGFIAPYSGGYDMFFKAEDVINPPLSEGQKVTFEIGKYKGKEACAVNVQKR